MRQGQKSRNGAVASKLNRCIFPATAAALVLCRTHSLRAAQVIWTGTSSGGDGVTWTNANNWTALPSSNLPGDDLTFGSGTVGTINLNGDELANSLTFNAGFTLDAPNSVNTLTVTTGTIALSGGASATINSMLGGNSGLKLSGAGTLTLNGTQAYSGQTSVNGGTLVLGPDSVFNAGALTVNAAGSLAVDANTTIDIGSVSNSGNFTISSSETFTFSTASSVFTQSGGTLTINGTLNTDQAGFTYSGGSIIGTVQIGDNSFAPSLTFTSGAGASGTFLIGGEGVVFNGTNPQATKAGQILDFTPTATTGTMTITTNFSNAGSLTMTGSSSSTASLAMSTHTLTNTGTLTTAASGSTSSVTDFITGVLNSSTGTVNINASTTNTGSVTNSSAFNIATGQTFKMAGAASIFTESAGQTSVPVGGVLDVSAGTLSPNGGTILLAADASTPAVLKLGTTKFTGTTTTGTIASTVPGVGQSPGYVDLLGVTPTLTIGTGTQSAQVIISAPITDGGLIKAGVGTLQLSGANTYALGTSVTAGMLQILPTSPLSTTVSALGDGALTISGTGAVQLATNVTLGSQGSPTPASNVNITSLSIAGTGKLDINNNHIIIDYTAGNDPIASIVSWIDSGANVTGGFATWTGNGITSTAAAANAGSYGIGYADAADPGNPAGLASGQIEIMYTLLGDANLDGKVNGTDFNILAANFNTGGDSWDQGDFNYDGKVNGSDFNFLAANFNQGATQSADLVALDSFAAANGLSADVPEPEVVCLLLPASYLLLGKRRRAVCERAGDR